MSKVEGAGLDSSLIPDAIEVLRACRTVSEAAGRMSERWGIHVNPRSLANVFRRAGKDSPAFYLGGADDPAPGRRDAVPPPPPDDEIEITVEPPEEQGEAESLLELVRLTRRGPRSLEEVCDALDLSPAKARALVARARSQGLAVEIDGAHVGRRPPEESYDTPREVKVSAAGDRRIFAAVGDVHFGSKHHLGHYFKDFCDRAYARGVRTFLQVGDLLDGNYRHSVWEQSARGFDEQVQVAIDKLPRYDGATWHFIQGNHDETLGEHSGLDVGRAIEQAFRADGRSDLVYHGARGAYVRLCTPGDRRGLFVEMWHPREKSNAYALSYRLQKKVEKYAPGQKPDVLLAGHWHQSMFVTLRGVRAMSVGCWQGGQSAFGKSLGGSPSIGSWIVEYALTPDGTVRDFRPEWVEYFERETFRDVSLG